MTKRFDAIIVGSGVNGLSAAIFLQRKGLSTALYEKEPLPGGATKSHELTLPGFIHDMGSSIHPLTYDSPFLSKLPLEKYGLEWIQPKVAFAHPFIDGSAIGSFKSIDDTITNLGKDAKKYKYIFESLVDDWNYIKEDLLGPLHMPQYPIRFLKFGLQAIQSAISFAERKFTEEKTKAFFLGAAAHSTLPLTDIASSSFGLVLMILAHITGWPYPKGGASAITESLLKYYKDIGGRIYLNKEINNLNELPENKAVLLDLTPRQILSIEGTDFSGLYKSRLSKYQYGTGVFKMDWALSEPVPFKNELCRNAGTVHIGYTVDELRKSELLPHKGKICKRPYVLFAQHSVFDPTRAPEGKHTAWAYCHVPLYSNIDMTEYIENQIEKAAPGFRDCILKRSGMTANKMEQWNPNLVGGDINGGKQNIRQIFARPVLKFPPYRTSNPSIYICSSSTPPGGGVHGMCGYHAAKTVLSDHF